MRGALFALCLMATAAQAQSYLYLPFRMMSTTQQPFPYFLDDRAAAPSGLALANVKVATETAWNTWNAVSCAAPKVASQGYASLANIPRPNDAYDVYSVTPVWITSSSDPDYNDILGTQLIVALSLPLSYAGVLQTCDTYLNAVDFTFSTSTTPPANAVDLQTVMTHEAGHCLGLDHLGDLSDVMQAAIVPGQIKQALGANDVAALCQRNPAFGAPGAPCLSDGGCGGAANVKCLSQPAGPRLCGNACSLGTGAGCDLPLSCQASVAFSPNYNGACLMPGSSVTAVGHPCEDAGDCGASVSECFTPSALPSGYSAWASGYCSEPCEAGQAACPAGSTCITLNDTTKHCLKQCRVGLADCRPEYACAQTSAGGVCVPRCYTNNDCADALTYECRICDGLCAARQNPSGQVGDVCTQDLQCGAGQVCLQVDERSGTRLCTQGCGRGCGTCPTGSSCHPLARGDLYCLRDCAGPGTCPAGLRCGQLGTGSGCVPACATSNDCPVGQQCSGGECLNPIPPDDSGTCTTLCTPVDSGRPIVPVVRDGGSSGGGSAGCGCRADASGTLTVAMGWAVLLFARRLAWRRR